MDEKSTEKDEQIITLEETVYDLIKDIKDPEKPETLEELNVVYQEGVLVERLKNDGYLVKITFAPTISHCSLASLIGLTLRQKLARTFPEKFKLDIFIKEGTHETAAETSVSAVVEVLGEALGDKHAIHLHVPGSKTATKVTKQINDKERVSAAMENPNLQKLIDECVENDSGY